MALLKADTAAMTTVRRVKRIITIVVLFVRMMLRENTNLTMLLHVSAIPVTLNSEQFRLDSTVMQHVKPVMIPHLQIV
jgi:hypothetical protein